VSSLVTLIQSLGVAYATGLNMYATVAIVGLCARFGLVHGIPSSLWWLGSWWVIAIASALYIVEFAATLVPGIASAWETVHSLLRPPAAAALSAATAWHSDPLLVLLAALLGGGMGVATHTTKLGLRYAIDTSPEPITNGATNIAELGLVGALVVAIWQHPIIAFVVAIALLLGLMVIVRLIWRALRQVFGGHWMPSRGLLQEPRSSAPAVRRPKEAE
jgi:hypothetical protein